MNNNRPIGLSRRAYSTALIGLLVLSSIFLTSCIGDRVGAIKHYGDEYAVVQIPESRTVLTVPKELALRWEALQGDSGSPPPEYLSMLSSIYLGSTLGRHTISLLIVRVSPTDLANEVRAQNQFMSTRAMPRPEAMRRQVVPDPFLQDVVPGVPMFRDLTGTPLRKKYRYCFFAVAPDKTLSVCVITESTQREELEYADTVFDTVWRSVRQEPAPAVGAPVQPRKDP